MKKIVMLIFIFTIFACKKENKSITILTSKPIKLYSNNTVSVKAYDYKGLAPLLKQQNDSIYVINFWATWCKPCIEELPYFEKVTAKYKDKKVKVILVSLDMKNQVESKLLPYVSENKLASEVVLLSDPDSNTWIPKIDSTWSGAIPATIIYNAKKRKFYEQSFAFDTLEKEVQLFIN
jgi:thiol-disulfide isomerase/thioredoxin